MKWGRRLVVLELDICATLDQKFRFSVDQCEMQWRRVPIVLGINVRAVPDQRYSELEFPLDRDEMGQSFQC